VLDLEAAERGIVCVCVCDAICFFFFKIYLFIGKSDIQKGRETERKIFHLMIHSPSDRNGQCCAVLKPGSRNFFRVLHTGAGSQGFGLSSTAFPGHKQGAGWEVELLGLELAPIWDPGTFKARTLAARPQCRAQFFLLHFIL